ncbi:MAG: thymidylate kinase [Patescibacteria group bacterium]|nr:thymidylate kinase [Patescibacteria group bacterium]MDD5716089.1 thymidylate kinase [Patescibacteria group bacterium]
MSKRGKLIVFDAIDGAGKTTQVKLLAQHLRRSKKKFVLTDFPQYEKSFFGKMVRRYLRGEFGTATTSNPYLVSLLYALDRFEARDYLSKKLERGIHIICDRYAPANKIHQASKIRNPRKKEEFLAWLDIMEFKVLGIPKPDLVLFLDVPPAIARQLMASRKRLDMHETDFAYQKKVYRENARLVKRYKNWKRIQCVRRGRLLLPEEIHWKIWGVVKTII